MLEEIVNNSKKFLRKDKKVREKAHKTFLQK